MDGVAPTAGAATLRARSTNVAIVDVLIDGCRGDGELGGSRSSIGNASLSNPGVVHGAAQVAAAPPLISSVPPLHSSFTTRDDLFEARRNNLAAGSSDSGKDVYVTRPLLRSNSNSPTHPSSLNIAISVVEPVPGSAWRALLQPVAALAVPISVSQVAQFSITMVMLAAVGHLGVEQMGGASIAFGLVSATAFAFSSGLCGALETLLSQSFGSDPHSKLYGVYTQRMLGVLLLFSFPLSLCLAQVESALVWMGEPREVAYYAGRFCRAASLVAVGPVMLLELLRRYLVSQRLPNPVLVVVLAAAVANPVLVYFAVEALGFDGVALAFAILNVFMDLGLLGYLRVTGVYRQTWGGWSAAALEQWGPLLRLALPSLAMALSEWTTLEVNSVVAGLGTPVQLAAFAVSAQLASICWALPSGVFMAATVLVGNSIGSGVNQRAKCFAAVTTLVSLALALINVTVTLCFRRGIVRLFTEDSAVVELFATRVMPWMLAYHVADAISSNSLAILRGVGMQRLGMIIVLGSIAVVGTPTGIVLFVRLHWGVEALWIGPLLGYVVVALPAHAYVLLRRVDWMNLKAAVGSEMLSHH